MITGRKIYRLNDVREWQIAENAGNERVARLATQDPLAEKYKSCTPYNYCINNPINIVDITGTEGIVVSGSPGNHKNKLHFLINGLDRAKQLKNKVSGSEDVTWIIYNDKKNGFSQKDINKYSAQAQKLGINVREFSEVNDIINYVNEKSGKKDREKDQISIFYYIGHALPGSLNVGYSGTGQSLDPKNFDSSSFKSGAYINLVGGCRTAVPPKILLIPIGRSVIQKFANNLDKQSVIQGSNVRVTYPGGVVSDSKLVQKNSGSIVTINGTR